MPPTETGHRCLLVAIEGADMVGKATQSHMLEEALLNAGIKATAEEIPYDEGVTHGIIYEMLRDGVARSSPDAFQVAQCLNRIFFWRNYLPTLAAHHEVLLLDRWTLSTRVYGEAGGASADVTEGLLRHVKDADLNLVIDAPAWPKTGRDVLERDDPFQQRVRYLYHQACVRDPATNVKIDGARPVDDVHRDLLKRVLGLLGPDRLAMKKRRERR
jgi:thymidylate kinase